jgi:hypothetical protein
MKIHLFRQDLQDYQDFFDLVYLSCSSCQKNKILFRLVSFSSGLDARGQRRRSYETTPKWHGFLMIKLAAFQAGGWAET